MAIRLRKRPESQEERTKRLARRGNPFALMALSLNPCGHKSMDPRCGRPCGNPPLEAERLANIESATDQWVPGAKYKKKEN